MKFYLDSCIWIDYLDKKREHHSRAVKLFEKIKKEKQKIIITWIHAMEMGEEYRTKYIKLKNKLYKQGLCFGVKDTEVDRQIAYKHNISMKLGYYDCLHLLIAKKHKAKAVSSDEHWQEIATVYGMRVYKYEDLAE